MNKLRRSVVLLLVLALGTSCREKERADSIGEPNSVKAESSDGYTRLPSSATTQTNNLLPPSDRALRNIVQELKERASKGDALASCRLAAEYDYCEGFVARLSKLNETLENQRSISAESGNKSSDAIVALEANAKELLSQADRCEGVVMPSPAERISYWRDSAQRGHVPSMVMYASGRVFYPSDTLSHLEELGIYKTEALSMATQAAQAGSMEALQALAAAYSPREYNVIGSSNLLGQVVTPNPVEALTLYYFLRLSLNELSSEGSSVVLADVERKISQLEKDLSAQSLRSAADEASRRRQSWRAPKKNLR